MKLKFYSEAQMGSYLSRRYFSGFNSEGSRKLVLTKKAGTYPDEAVVVGSVSHDHGAARGQPLQTSCEQFLSVGYVVQHLDHEYEIHGGRGAGPVLHPGRHVRHLTRIGRVICYLWGFSNVRC